MQHKWVRIVAVVVGLVVFTSACNSDALEPPPTLDPNTAVEVTYQVLGDMTRTEITYTTENGEDIFRGEEDLPFEVTFSMSPGDILDLGAQTDGSTVTCRILIEGAKLIESTETNGNFPVCQGVVPGAG